MFGQPGLILNSEKEPVALCGRVFVSVTIRFLPLSPGERDEVV